MDVIKKQQTVTKEIYCCPTCDHEYSDEIYARECYARHIQEGKRKSLNLQQCAEIEACGHEFKDSYKIDYTEVASSGREYDMGSSYISNLERTCCKCGLIQTQSFYNSQKFNQAQLENLWLQLAPLEQNKLGSVEAEGKEYCGALYPKQNVFPLTVILKTREGFEKRFETYEHPPMRISIAKRPKMLPLTAYKELPDHVEYETMEFEPKKHTLSLFYYEER